MDIYGLTIIHIQNRKLPPSDGVEAEEIYYSRQAGARLLKPVALQTAAAAAGLILIFGMTLT